ncbi:MAG: hypothetical protein ACK5WZ_05130 [Pseudobdellovibrionaceae bacterium]
MITLLFLNSFVQASEEKKENPVKEAPPEWMMLQTEIQKLSADIKAKQDQLVSLFSSGHGNGKTAHGPPAKANVAAKKSESQEISKEHKALRDLISEYEKKRTILRYRYPEAGAQTDRKYQRIELKSIDQLKTETLVERRLRQTSEKIKKVYGYEDQPYGKSSKIVKESAAQGGRQPASENNPVDEKIPLLDEQIILKK